MAFQSINPATEEVEATFNEHTADEVEKALESAARTFDTWRKTPFTERSRHMIAAAAYLRANKTRLGLLMTDEMGKPILQAEAEVEKCA